MARFRTTAALLLLGVLTFTGSASVAVASVGEARSAFDLGFFDAGSGDSLAVVAPAVEDRPFAQPGPLEKAAPSDHELGGDDGRRIGSAEQLADDFAALRLHLRLRVLII